MKSAIAECAAPDCCSRLNRESGLARKLPKLRNEKSCYLAPSGSSSSTNERALSFWIDEAAKL